MKRDEWLGIELRHFAALAAIAEERSFWAAAERLGYVQSAISRQIAQLEQLTGSRLIERSRGPKPVYLTESGAMLLTHAHNILGTIEAAKSDLEDRAADSTDELRLGLFGGVPTRIAAAAVPAFGNRCPTVRVTASEAVSDGPLFDLVRKGRVDLAFAHLPGEPGPFAECELLDVPWVLVVPAGAEIASSPTPPTLAQVARLPLIGFESPRMEPWTQEGPQADVTPRIVFRCEAAHTAQALVGGGLGATLMPRLAVREGDPRTDVVELGDLLQPATIGLVWLRDRTLPTEIVQFRELARQISSAIARQLSKKRRFGREGAAQSRSGDDPLAVAGDPPSRRLDPPPRRPSSSSARAPAGEPLVRPSSGEPRPPMRVPLVQLCLSFNIRC
jgi:DNA-binding transcriptional LysR family regulator